MKILFFAAVSFTILSYGFVDPNFPHLQSALTTLVYRSPVIAAGMYILILLVLYAGYIIVLNVYKDKRKKRIPRWVIGLVILLFLSYPALSYDIFNYILTAKVTYLYQENPYIVMPIEIPNEPMLGFTRAANKLALYGPTWIILTVFPYLTGMNNILVTLFTFKLFVAVFYALFVYFLYRKSRSIRQTLFFALNPLILIEIVGSGHNDIVMMVLGIAGITLWRRSNLQYKIVGLILFFSSVLVKGASIALFPLLFVPKWKEERLYSFGFWLMVIVFLISPIREEMYPWYAIWWLTFASLIPEKNNSIFHELCIWLSLGLCLRYVPWIATREYGGITPMLREVLTIVPIGVYSIKRFLWPRFSSR